MDVALEIKDFNSLIFFHNHYAAFIPKVKQSFGKLCTICGGLKIPISL
jgi:hypothetical protein